MDLFTQSDHQAENHCYRLGQTRAVTIYKLFVAGTVDAMIADIADQIDTSLQIYLDQNLTAHL